MSSGLFHRIFRKQLLCPLRKIFYQPAAPQRLHDHHRDPFAVGIVQAPPSRLGVLIHIVVLDLGKVPIPGIQQTAEGIRAAVVGKAYLADLTVFFLLPQPPVHAQIHQPLPGGRVCKHMHQVVVDVIGAKALQFLPEQLFQSIVAFDQVVGKLGGNVHLVPQTVFLQDLPHRSLAAGIDIGCIQVIYTAPDRLQQLLFRLLHINGPQLPGEAHTAIA